MTTSSNADVIARAVHTYITVRRPGSVRSALLNNALGTILNHSTSPGPDDELISSDTYIHCY